MLFSKVWMVCGVLTLLLGCTAPLLAHELLPQEVIRYLESNPDATSEELRAFAATQDPGVAATIMNQSTTDLVLLVQNEDNGFWHNIWDFIKLGARHILAGADHVLFVLTLLLVFSTFKEILKLVTVFTIAHSLTILLAGTGVLLLSSSLVEPVIALSIAVMAILTVFFRHIPIMKNHTGKAVLVFIFGLFHGLGFAGLLEEIAIPANKFLSSLLAFNVGIEFGQLFVIALALPVLVYVKRYSWYEMSIKIAAVFISLLASLWFIERVLGN